jgi:hypothetical protein
LKKHFEIEVGLLKGENEILQKELLASRCYGGSSKSPNNPKQGFHSPPRNARGELSPYQNAAAEKVIEAKNKDIVALTLKLEELMNKPQQVEHIRRSILVELGSQVNRLGYELTKSKSMITGLDSAHYKYEVQPPHYSQVTEEAFLNEVH